MSIDYIKLANEIKKSNEQIKDNKKESDEDRRERVARDKANIQRVDNQIKS